MSNAAIAKPIYTREEFHTLELRATTRHEYFGGEIYAMAGGSKTHARIITQVAFALNARLQDTTCIAVTSDQLVYIEADDLEAYPDVVVYCDDARFDAQYPNTLLEPCLLVEVLSSSTANYDRTAKREAYQRIPTLTDYLMVWQDSVRIEHDARRDESWHIRRYGLRTDAVRLEPLGIEFSVEEIYRRLDLPEAGNLSAVE